MRSNLVILALAGGTILLPGGAMARSWAAPEGCEIFMTVQAKACRVSNHYTCASDADGDQWRADFDQEGLFFRSRINFESEWVESIVIDRSAGGEMGERLMPGAPDPASYSELLETGHNAFSFSQIRDDGIVTHSTGFDRLTGRSARLDGVLLEETAFEYEQTDDAGNVVHRARGNEYINREMRLFFAGPGETDFGDGEWLPIDGRPVDFIFPGEPGFASTQPLYDCDALTAQGDAPGRLQDMIVKVRHGG